MRAVVILIFVSSIFSAHADDADILCTASYCEEYLDDNTCADIPTKCSIQNSTHNGVFLPFAGPCNCCDYCVANLDEGDSCAVGTAASPLPTIICGDLLNCTAHIDDEVTTCQTIVSKCTDAQREYDVARQEGTLGHLQVRPTCGRRGEYGPFQCIPGEICYCVSEEGDRIFGEIPYTVLASSIMNCECSRSYNRTSEYMGKSLRHGEFMRCNSNGDYDPIQCVDDDCFCVHTNDGSLAINRVEDVNITSISNETLSCFNFDLHVEGEYYRECEAQVIAILEEIADYEKMGYEVFGYIFPNCQLDGFYAAVQTNDTSKYCAAPNGDILEDFIVGINDPLADNMNCKCARSRSMDIQDRPDCCKNGNYKPMQCRRGLCRCVDENGNQIRQEVPAARKHTLSCYNVDCLSEETSDDNEGEN